MIWNSCTHKKYIQYEIMPYVLDGEPDYPDSSMIVAQKKDSVVVKKNTDKRVAIQPVSFIHKPFETKQCESCHTKNMKLLQKEPDLCYSCHDNFFEKYSNIHGPVDGGFCTKCHSAHKSKIDKLLIAKGQLLCTSCHLHKDIIRNDVHADIGETYCTECHNPHGGTDKFLLR